jgi:hypothetical protein
MDTSAIDSMLQWSLRTQHELDKLGIDLPPMPPYPHSTEPYSSVKRPSFTHPYSPQQWCDRVRRWYEFLVDMNLWPLVGDVEVVEEGPELTTTASTTMSSSMPIATPKTHRIVRFDPYDLTKVVKEVRMPRS